MPDSASHRVFGLFGASLETNNLGVSALTHATVAAFIDALPTDTLLLFDYARQPAEYTFRVSDQDKRVAMQNLRFSKQPWLHNHIVRLLACAVLLRLLPSGRARRALLARHPRCAALLGCTAFLSLAGGDSFSDIYGPRRFFYVVLPKLLAIWLKVPLVLLPQTYGPYKSWLARQVAGYILRRADWVLTRDQGGAEVVAKLGVETKRPVEFSYDMAFALRAHPLPAETEASLAGIPTDKPLLGLNISGLLYIGGYNRKNMFGLCVDYPSVVLELLKFAIDDLGCHVLLVPHVLTGKGNPESDVTACELVLEQLSDKYLRSLTLPVGVLDQSQTKMLISRCDFLVASRMHACIGAISQCVPALGLAYSDKFIGVLGTVGVRDSVLDLRRCTRDDIFRSMKTQFLSREDIKSRLRERMPAIVESVGRLFGKLGTSSFLAERPVLAGTIPGGRDAEAKGQDS